MRTFLLKDKVPICKWGMIPENTYFSGKVPDGYSLAISPHDPYIIVDVDKRGILNGIDNIPKNLLVELKNTFNYNTKNGVHFWLKYSGDKNLLNKTSKILIDLRTSSGYVKYNHDKDIRECEHLIKPTSKLLNEWLESLFMGVQNYK